MLRRNALNATLPGGLALFSRRTPFTSGKKPTSVFDVDDTIPRPDRKVDYTPQPDAKSPLGTGPDNKAGVYEKPNEPAYFAQGKYGGPRRVHETTARKDPVDNILEAEHQTAAGLFENPPPASRTGGPGAMKYHDYEHRVPKRTTEDSDVFKKYPQADHHPEYDYRQKSGKVEGDISHRAHFLVTMELRLSRMSLYRSCLKAIPLFKQFYWIHIPIEEMKMRIKERFLLNKHIQDEDAIRHLIYSAWAEYYDCISMKKPRFMLMRYFAATENEYDLQRIYAEEEGRLIEDRKHWSGAEQRREGPYDGYWSEPGQAAAERFEKLKGRVPTSYKVSKGFFEPFKPDGTNWWEKNVDYEGWYLKNVDPDRRAARHEFAPETEAKGMLPIHHLAKNRRAYRRLVNSIESFFTDTPEETYARSREVMYQYNIRERQPEANRVHAEKTIARMDDEFYGHKQDEKYMAMKQIIREMPNPRMWRTDAFFMRFRQLTKHLEFNWSTAPIGRAQEKIFNEWISNSANYTIFNSPVREEIKSDKQRNPMARTWAEFYLNFDPERPETRTLPWYHPEFNYETRWNWDELCVRRKKWAVNGDIDSKRPYFDAMIHEAEQNIHRDERAVFDHGTENAEKKFLSPRVVQLYRAFNRRLDVAMTMQMQEFIVKQNKSVADVDALLKMDEAAVNKILAQTNFSSFKFEVPVFIYPDGAEQPAQGLEGALAAQV